MRMTRVSARGGCFHTHAKQSRAVWAALVPVRNTKQTIYRRDKDLTWLCVLQALVWGSVRGQLVALRSKVSKGGWVEGNVLVFVAHAAARVRGQVFRAHL